MKVKQMIELLNTFDQEMECFVYADHGQNYIKADRPSFTYMDKDDIVDLYYIESSYCEEDIEDDKQNFIKVCVISD